ncbi:tRNA (carboxymethyluridine(34)-5-O)-methyltransferase-like isoform X2 [Dendronephthya gigantea]|uniref:tRNA (carboxymethyluridine(34)-5-O)-methyltransferase-like isoform X2 n=1 Tax=Dendronephthya gigantea TaxID=151771 RepID=UPI00106A2695|nr:tRNA (carboxymethyluridine(34)-5-O)-methyltransferase-like isoform X2 [Dendronephthya gigantea]
MSNANTTCQEERAKKIEHKYVHNVYSSQALSYDDLCDGPWPKIKNFLFGLRPGSFVADVGCGNGKYLKVRGDLVVHGVDVCQELSHLAYERHKNIIIANNLNLPYRSSTMDAVISVGVLHHFASYKRRLQSVKELARILKPGGQILIYVWACEQKKRKFSSQNVLIPWKTESAKKEDCFCNQNIQPNEVNTKKKHFVGNYCLENLSMTETGEDVPNFKMKNTEEEVGIDVQPRKGDSLIAVDNSCDQISDDEKQQGNSIINSISIFTEDLKEKLQRLSFPAIGKTSPSVEGRNCGESNSNPHDELQKNCVNTVHDLTLKHSAFSAKCKQKLDRTEQERFKRFYHVFTKEELSELLQNVRRLKILSQCYDHGNWVVKAERLDAPE